MKHLILTARDLLHKLAHDLRVSYQEVAKRVNVQMSEGLGLVEAVHAIAREAHLDVDEYSLDAVGIADEVRLILSADYSQTLMISAVLAQMVSGTGPDRLPIPAFIAFLELLSSISAVPKPVRNEAPEDVDEQTTRVIELCTSLVSVINDWSKEGIVGVSRSCPKSLIGVSKAVLRKTRMYQQGMWSCLSCGRIIDFRDAHGLLCSDCDAKFYGERAEEDVAERNRTGYGRSTT
ncbi:MAG: hypothetical protein HXY34_13880 [Candidatus Thorarchaeota archaeon]|nr:hypothetical protein [Candidatus Thorarchaeota archaeon]